jgi:ribose 1,5-bisphosphokinase
LPARLDETIASGHVAVANVSRGAIALLKARYTNVIVVEITASADILAQRLAARGRESRGEVLARLARSAELGGSIAGATTIDNSGLREEAGERFVALLRKAIAVSDVAGTV